MEEKPSQQFLLGIKDELPILVGVVPFGMIYGALALSVGLSTLEAQAMSAIVFAGSAQFMLAQLVREGTPWLVIIVTGFVINLRHALYSATIAPYIKCLTRRWKALLAYLLTDEAFAVTALNYQRQGATRLGHWYFLGAGLALWTSWQISTAVGIFLSAQVPESWGLDFTLPLTFIVLVAPTLKDKASVTTAIIASLAALLFFSLPYKLGVIVSAALAIAAGVWVEARQ